jgi:hypothetical protein
MTRFEELKALNPVDVQYPNRPFQLEGRSDPYIKLDLFPGVHSQQLSIGTIPAIRWYSTLALTLATKEGTGYLTAYSLIQPFLEGLSCQVVQGVYTDTSGSTRMSVLQGWQHRPYLIPFWHISNLPL